MLVVPKEVYGRVAVPRASSRRSLQPAAPLAAELLLARFGLLHTLLLLVFPFLLVLGSAWAIRPPAQVRTV
jgi:hypothetical protein